MSLSFAILGCVLLSLITMASAAAGDDLARPRIPGLSHIALYVRDIDKSRAFYKDFLGFDEPYSIHDPDGNRTQYATDRPKARVSVRKNQ